MTGLTNSSLDGNTYQGGTDIFLSQFSVDGAKFWTTQYGSTTTDRANSVATDSCGNIYVTGWTAGDLDGSSQGSWDIFLSQLNTNGTVLWTKQYGTERVDRAYSVATDSSGNIYVTGWTDGDLGSPNQGYYVIFLTKFIDEAHYTRSDYNGDFNADGKADILWRNKITGQNWIYLMDGTTIVSSQALSILPAEWDVAQASQTMMETVNQIFFGETVLQEITGSI